MDIESYKKVPLPYLRVNVLFLDLSKLKDVPQKGSAYTCILGDIKEDGTVNIGVFISEIEVSVKEIKRIPMIVHELIHVIQIICDQRSMAIEQENEGMAYLASFLLEELLSGK